MSNPSPISNSTIEALDHAIADLESKVAELPPQPAKVTAVDDDVRVTLNADGQLVAARFTTAAMRQGLTLLADRILKLQDLAFETLTSGMVTEGVEIEYAEVAGAAPALGTDAPQLSDMPTFADIKRVADAFDALFEQPGPREYQGDHRGVSEWLELKVDAVGRLSELVFRDPARNVDSEALADDLVETAARARAGLV